MRYTPIVTILLAALLTSAGAGRAAEAKPPSGDYYCYVYASKAIFVGALTLRDDGTYKVKDKDVTGRYRLAGAANTLAWDGPPPLGFEAAVLETEDGHTKLRLYRKAEDIGNKWKAAVCSLREPRS